MKPALHALFVEYEDSHRHPTNRLTHKIAIPFIVFHVLAMLDWVALAPIPGTSFTLTLGHLVWVAAAGWYLSMDLKLGVIMAFFTALCLPLGAVTPRPVVIAVAVIGWLVQLAGHQVWEKKSPAFLRNMFQALIGPLFFVALITGDWKLGVHVQAAPAGGAPTPAPAGQ